MKLNLDPPIVNCSGIFSYPDVFELLDRKGAAFGGYVTKSIGLEERNGNKNPTVLEGEGFLMNSMALPNPGIEACIEELNGIQLTKPLIASVFGFSVPDYREVVRHLEEGVKYIAAYEINESCPNIIPGETSISSRFGTDPRLTQELISSIRKITGKPIIAKITPNTENYVEVALAAEEAGADYIGCSNTFDSTRLSGLSVERDVLAGGLGGISGPLIKKYNLQIVRHVHEAIDKERTGIIAYGGIGSSRDIVEYYLHGAEIFGLGTCIAYRRTTDDIVRDTKMIWREFQNYLQNNSRELRGAVNV
jgi:dihydroorotate dehydrogenase (NAD+) catalytic subunit